MRASMHCLALRALVDGRSEDARRRRRLANQWPFVWLKQDDQAGSYKHRENRRLKGALWVCSGLAPLAVGDGHGSCSRRARRSSPAGYETAAPSGAVVRVRCLPRTILGGGMWDVGIPVVLCGLRNLHTCVRFPYHGASRHAARNTAMAKCKSGLSGSRERQAS